MSRETGCTPAAQNKKARHDYQIGETYEAGLVLTGTEVKVLRMGRVSLAEAFATVDDGEVRLRNVNIPEYEFGTWRNHATKRSRELLLNCKGITRLVEETEATGRTIVPLSIYFKDGYAKVEMAVVTGKRDWDKRRNIVECDMDREAQRALWARSRLGSRRR